MLAFVSLWKSWKNKIELIMTTEIKTYKKTSKHK